jgi:hypothetical protein
MTKKTLTRMGSSEESDEDDDEATLESQVLVSPVCRRWHSLALATRRLTLWTILDFSRNSIIAKAAE